VVATLAATMFAAVAAADDIILVVDTTKDMAKAMDPIATAIDLATDQFRTTIEGKRSRLGLIAYRDRKIGKECDIEYVTRWLMPLGPSTGTTAFRSVASLLKPEQTTKCSSDEEAEAGLDGLNRALLDTSWRQDTPRTIILIAGSPFHGPSSDKNPQRLDTRRIHELADRENVRIHTLFITTDPRPELASLAPIARDRKSELAGHFETATMSQPQIAKATFALLKRTLQNP